VTSYPWSRIASGYLVDGSERGIQTSGTRLLAEEMVMITTSQNPGDGTQLR